MVRKVSVVLFGIVIVGCSATVTPTPDVGGFTLWLDAYAADRGGEFSAPLEVELP